MDKQTTSQQNDITPRLCQAAEIPYEHPRHKN